MAWHQIAALIGVPLALAWLFWPSLSKVFGGAGAWLSQQTITEEPLDEEYADLQALRRMAKRYETSGPGRAAVQTLYREFFHDQQG
jgi:hypothetical protein